MTIQEFKSLKIEDCVRGVEIATKLRDLKHLHNNNLISDGECLLRLHRLLEAERKEEFEDGLRRLAQYFDQ